MYFTILCQVKCICLMSVKYSEVAIADSAKLSILSIYIVTDQFSYFDYTVKNEYRTWEKFGGVKYWRIG